MLAGIDQRIILVFCFAFIGLGLFNIYLGWRRIRLGQQVVRWYKQINILTGIEYILLSLAFLVSLSINSGWISASLNWLVGPLYFAIVASAAALAGFIIFLTFQARRTKQPVQTAASQSTPEDEKAQEMTAEERAAHIRKRRERRKKAAAARRRQSGKA